MMPEASSFLVSLYGRGGGHDFWICECKQRTKPPEANLILIQMWESTYLPETPGSWEAIDVSYMYVHWEMAE